MTITNVMKDKIQGSLIGGAIGDALGYPVEFLNYDSIQKSYGERGITRFDLEPYWLDKSEHTGKAIVSDDTQMTLFTACGLMNAQRQGIAPIYGIKEAYLEWLTTQDNRFMLDSEAKCWITTIPELNVRRAPGNTCLTSLGAIARKHTPVNQSKGCGGVMRIAPVPLYAAVGERMGVVEAAQLAGDAAQLTHHHPLGYIPAALMAHVIYRLLQDEQPCLTCFEAYIHEGMKQVKELYAESKTSLRTMEQLVEQALALSKNNQPDIENIEKHLGGGWVAEETLAISLYCILRYFPTDLSQDNLSSFFERAIIASVNHSGDSDSTGSVTGNIIGVITGYNAIPQFYKTDLEHHDIIIKLADEIIMTSIHELP